MGDMKEKIPICPHRTFEDIDISLIAALDALEKRLEWDLTFSSGVRCEACNAAAGGVKKSAHLKGRAVDIIIDNSVERYELANQALSLGFNRIGIGRKFVHLDVDYSLPMHMLWLY